MKELRVIYLPPAILAALLLHWAGQSAAHGDPPFGAPSEMLTAEQIAQQQHQQQQQQATKGGGGDSDDLLLLSDDEVLHHGKLLRDLRHANKAEVEELIDNNPVLQEIVLRRIQAQLERQHQAKYYKAKPRPIANPGGHHLVVEQQQQQQLDVDELEDEDEFAEVDKKKYDSLKVKLKSNAAKIFKMGSGFKEKVDALKRKYKNKTKEYEHQYKVYEKEKDYEPKYKAIEKEPAGKYKVFEKDKEKEKQFAKVPKFYVDVSH